MRRHTAKVVFLALWFNFLNVFGQRLEVGLVFIDDLQGEKIRIANESFNVDLGVSAGHSFINFGTGSPEEILARLNRTAFYLKAGKSKRFRKLNLNIPTNPKKYLVFNRVKDSKTKRFILEWSDELPYKPIDRHIDEFRIDTTNLVYPKPELLIRYQGSQLSKDQLRTGQHFPNQILLFEFLLNQPEKTQDSKLMPIIQGIEIMFADSNNQMVQRTVFLGNKRLVTIYWPNMKPLGDGCSIIFNVVYGYFENDI